MSDIRDDACAWCGAAFRERREPPWGPPWMVTIVPPMPELLAAMAARTDVAAHSVPTCGRRCGDNLRGFTLEAVEARARMLFGMVGHRRLAEVEVELTALRTANHALEKETERLREQVANLEGDHLRDLHVPAGAIPPQSKDVGRIVDFGRIVAGRDLAEDGPSAVSLAPAAGPRGPVIYCQNEED